MFEVNTRDFGQESSSEEGRDAGDLEEDLHELEDLEVKL